MRCPRCKMMTLGPKCSHCGYPIPRLPPKKKIARTKSLPLRLSKKPSGPYCPACGTPNKLSLRCVGCGRWNPRYVILTTRSGRKERRPTISLPIKSVQTLRDQFEAFCNRSEMVEFWGRRALDSSGRTLVRIYGEVFRMRQTFAKLPSQNPIGAALQLVSKGRWTTIQFIAFFTCFRELFKVQVKKVIGKGKSGHVDVPVRFWLGGFVIRNSYDDKGTGTTRLYLHTASNDILDPSYSVIRELIKAFGSQKNTADFVRRFALAQTITKTDHDFCSKVIKISMGKKNLFEDLSSEPSSSHFMLFDKPKKPKSHDYSAFASIGSKGKQTISVRIGDVLAFLWGLLFIAEGRHSPLVAHSNFLLLDLISEGHLRFEDCLINFSHTKNKVKQLQSFSGSLFPSSNFAPYGYQYKLPHKKRYQHLQTLSGMDVKTRGPTPKRIDLFVDQSDTRLDKLLTSVRKSSGFPDVELFVLYKIAFIEYLRQERYPKLFSLSLFGKKTQTPPKSLKGLNVETLMKVLSSLGGSSSSSSVSSATNQTQGEFSQFDIPGCGTACSPIAVLAIRALMTARRRLTTTEINNIVIRGGAAYQAIVGNQQTMLGYMAQVSKKPSKHKVIEGPHLNPYEIPQNVLAAHNLAWGGQRSAYRFQLPRTLQTIFSSGGPVGVAILIGGYTVSVTLVNGTYYLFDSHGFGDVDAAFVESYSSLRGVVDRLFQMADQRLTGGQMSISIFRPSG